MVDQWTRKNLLGIVFFAYQLSERRSRPCRGRLNEYIDLIDALMGYKPAPQEAHQLRKLQLQTSSHRVSAFHIASCSEVGFVKLVGSAVTAFPHDFLWVFQASFWQFREQ